MSCVHTSAPNHGYRVSPVRRKRGWVPGVPGTTKVRAWLVEGGAPPVPAPPWVPDRGPASRIRLGRVEATPVVCRGCPVLQCLCGPFPIPGWSRVAFWWEVWFSSFCLLRTLATIAKVLAINGSPNSRRRSATREDGFGSLPAPRLNGARSGVRKDVTRLLPVFRS